MKLLVIEWIGILSLITFSISFLSTLRRTIKQNIFEELYTSFCGLEMMTDVEFLKCEGQKLKSIQVFVILTKLVMQLLSVTRILRQHHEI